jgi:hypothetical protein
VIIHRQNLGYGGNQKTCYDAALEAGADAVVMLHPDYQYDATRIPELVAPILSGQKDLMLGSRFLGDPLAGGMPKWKYVSNRFLTGTENLAFGLHLSEYHTGFRAYSRHLLETIPYRLNSDDFVFDQELVAQAVAWHAHRRDRRPHPILRGSQFGRLPAQRRLRVRDPSCGAAVLASPGSFETVRKVCRQEARSLGAVRGLTGTLVRSGLGILISAACIFLVLRGVDLDQTAQLLSDIQPDWLALAVIAGIGDLFFRALRWQCLIAPIHPVPLAG